MRLLVLVAILAGACGGGDPPIVRVPPPVVSTRPALLPGVPQSPRIASYRLAARLDVAAKTITATGTLTWRHTGAQPVTALPFHLYMNAFRSKDTVFMRESGGELRGAKLAEGTRGWIDVPSLRFEGKELRAGARHGEDETTLTVPLPRPVAPGETITIDLSFTTQLPEAFARTGWTKDHVIMAGQWFPKIGVLETKDGRDVWHCDTFHAASEFFADFGVYDVVLDVPDTQVVAATGVLTAVEEDGGRRRLTYHAEDVHDFAWLVDPWMQILRGKAGDVDIEIYYRPDAAAFAPRHLEAARRTLLTYSRLFYPYPWTKMTVVDPPRDAVWTIGGMEYPTLVTSGGDMPIQGVQSAELVTIHEVGHNWFQGLIASNEVDEAWLDEGLDEYTNGIVLDEWFGETASEGTRGGLHLGYYPQHTYTDASQIVKPVRTRSYEFAPEEYAEATYSKTTMALRTLEGLVGREAVHRALGVYARRYAFRHPTGDDFLAVMREELGEPAHRYLRAAFETTAIPDYRVLKMESKDSGHDVVVGNVGAMAFPVDVELRFADGQVETRRWDGAGFVRWHLEHPAALESVKIDPRHVVQLEAERQRNGLYEDGPRGPALRAAARVTFWEQTLLQVSGL